MNTKQRFFCAGLPLLLLSLASCSTNTISSSQSEPDTLPVYIVHADLASGVTNADELAAVGQVAVLATATATRQEPNPVDPTIVATIQSFTINELAWGETAGKSVEVKFTGGVVNDTERGPYMLQVEGQPQFTKNHKYFLVLLGPSPDGTYMVLGGPQGRNEVFQGRLQGVDGVDDPVVSALDGSDYTTAVRDLQDLASR